MIYLTQHNIISREINPNHQITKSSSDDTQHHHDSHKSITMSTILYKFRSSTTYTPLSLPGTSARLLDIKRAIVRDKKLDAAIGAPGSLEFDLQLTNAATEEVYEDESAIVPRGTRVVVRRVACERGRGILNRLAGSEVAPPSSAMSSGVDKSEFYTFRQGDGDEDEFITDAPQQPQQEQDESKELEALKAVTDQAGEMMGGRAWTGGGPSAPRPPMGAPHFPKPPPKQPMHRPDADPELRMQQPKVKKRATGIPRTFLSDGPTAAEDEEGATNDLASTLVTNKHAFETLVARSGGQSSNDPTTNLSYALKLTSTTLPEHLTCGICQNLVKSAMLVPWDELGRPACESCIRDGLLRNGYKCPMTGMEGVSPEDLFPNVGLRKAAEVFEKSVWEKMNEMERQIEEERRLEEEKEELKKKEEEFEDVGEGIVKRGVKKEKKRKVEEELDEFGGDVFDVVDEPEEEEEPMEPIIKEEPLKDDVEPSDETKDNNIKLETKDESNENDGQAKTETKGDDEVTNTDDNNVSNSSTNDKDDTVANAAAAPRKKEAPKRRGPPVGYMLGPAGANMMAPSPVMFGVNVPPPPPPPRPSNVEKNSDTASNKDSRSDSVDLSSGPQGNSSQGNGNTNTPGSPPPQMMGRGPGRGDGRYPGRFHDNRGGGFQGRVRYNDGYQGRGRGYQGRGGYGRGPPNQNWVSCLLIRSSGFALSL